MADSLANRVRAARDWLLQSGGVVVERFDLDPAVLAALRSQSGDPVERALQVAEAAVQIVDAIERATAGLDALEPPARSKKKTKTEELSLEKTDDLQN
jgi:hypothetical protein